MVFLVQDFVNLPADQIANIWLAAHMRKKVSKKDIKKTKLSAACSQLHSDKTKKPMQLRHYGQCLIGISWIHLKQVEFLHNDCNDAFSKARLVLVRKRNVDLDPSDSKNHAKDITLPAQRNGRDEEVLDIDLNAVNFSQLDMDFDDNVSEMGSVLGSLSHNGDNLALDHEITMQQNELTTVSPRLHDRRSSFGGMSSILMGDLGDMDIEIRFDDDEDDEVLDESQAKKASNDTMASLSVTDNNSQVEQGRGANNHTLLHNDNMSDNGSALHGQSGPADIGLSLLSDNHSQVSLAKEKSALHLDDMSLHSGSHMGSAMDAIPEDMNMDIDDASLMDDQQSLHVQFDLDAQSVNGSVATALVEPREEATPPSSPRNAVSSQNARASEAAASKAVKPKRKKSKKKKKKRKARFQSDKKIELSAEELRVAESEMDSAPFMFPNGRDPLHIWREFPLSSLPFDELLKQPLSRQQFGRFTDDIAKRFALCLERPRRKGEGPMMGDLMGHSDELANLDILRDHDDDVEKGRDDDDASDCAQGDLEHHNDMSLQMNDFSMDASDMDALEQHRAMDESVRPLIDDDDNASTLDSVMDDAIPPPRDPLYNENVADLTMPGELPDDDLSCLQEGEGEHDDDEDMEMPGAGEETADENHLSFGTEDQNVLTQMDDVLNAEQLLRDGIKPRDWSRRAKKTFSFFKNKPGEEFSFNELMTEGTKRQTVVGVFYELLVFKNSDLVDLKQEEPYGDITITKTANFHLHARVSQQMSQRR